MRATSGDGRQEAPEAAADVRVLPRWLLILLFLTVLSSLPSLQGSFLGDDYNLLLGLEEHGLVDFALLSRGDAGPLRFWRPFPFALLWLQHRLFGWEAAHYLVTGLTLHLAVVWLASQLFRRLLAAPTAALATALFALFPRHLEASAWISAQPDLWATLWLLVALAAWRRPAPGEDPPALETASPRTARRWVPVLLGGTLALLSKESAISLPLLALWLDREGALRERVYRTAPLFALVGLYLVARGLVLGSAVAGYGTETHLQIGLLPLLKPLATFTTALLVPLHTGAWSASLVQALKSRPWVFAGLAGVGLLAISAGLRRLSGRFDPLERRRLGTLLGLFLLSLIPYYNLSVSLSGRSDRYLYLPSIFFFPLLAFLLERWIDRSLTVRLAVALGVVGVLGVLRWDLASSYRTAGRLADTIVRRTVDIARTQPESRLYVAGVPERLDGVGVLFTGLPKAVQSWGAPGVGSRPEVIIPARTVVTRDLKPAVSWRVETRSGIDWVIGETIDGSPALLAGGAGWEGWRPDAPDARRPHAQLELPYLQDGLWVVVEEQRVRVLSN